jgi:nucleotide-binding universal stress UspA family protein
MYKTILVPLDGSKQAEAIFPYAENTALQYGAQIFFCG